VLLRLFWLFIKINFLTVSGPASIGLTKQLVVPALMTEPDFIQIASISSGIPGSDAIQMALQTGYKVSGVPGAIVSVIGALIPCILLVSLVMIGLNFVPRNILSAFFRGVAPALAVLLFVTAVQIIPTNMAIGVIVACVVLATILYLLKIPVVAILISCGIVGIASDFIVRGNK
jgi:chromate transporter